MRDKINALLEMDISGYRINKDNPEVLQDLISRLRTGNNSVDNIRLKTAEDLCRAYDYYMNKK